ncbi:Integrase core domain containing protein, partial [Aphelenchoides avenae]
TIKLKNGSTRTLHLPTTREEHAAELLLIWSAQQIHKPSRDLVDQFQLARSPDGILRCHGRIQHSDLPTTTINPVWLPANSRVAKHIAFDVHLLHQHAPQATTLGLLRRKYWVAHGRRFLSSLLRNWCAGCRMVRGPRFRHPQYAALPAERTKPCRPFAHIGLDLFGPYVVYTGPKPDNAQSSTKPRRRVKITRNLPPNMQKVWGVIFTCMATRAVHLEVVHSQSAAHLLLAFDSFVSRRGYPESVTSDNGSNIVLVSKTLDSIWRELLQDEKTKSHCRQHGIDWHFIVAEAPWQGGFYEKLVHNVKRSLNTAVGRRHISLPHFTQLLTRVEHTVNCRPITFQSDSDIANTPIRPIDFLQPLADVRTEDPLPQEEDGAYIPHRLTSSKELHESLRTLQRILDSFWRRWQHEYLLSLRERQKAQKESSTVQRSPQIGEYVFVDDDEMLPRPFWKMGRIINIFHGRDGTIRSVELRFPDGFTAERAVNRLYPLELEPTPPKQPEVERTPTPAQHPENSSHESTRPLRRSTRHQH